LLKERVELLTRLGLLIALRELVLLDGLLTLPCDPLTLRVGLAERIPEAERDGDDFIERAVLTWASATVRLKPNPMAKRTDRAFFLFMAGPPLVSWEG
jgi:hypothetical protein